MNKIRCLHCNAVVESVHHHDFRWCDCPEGSTTRVAVDGGGLYKKRAFSSGSAWVEFNDDGSESDVRNP